MSGEPSSNQDQDLLARLNALKKTHINLDDKQYRIPVTAHVKPSEGPSPARALHDDLLSRFKSLKVNKPQEQNPDGKDDNSGRQSDFVTAENNKTVEELLAELGSGDEWHIDKDETVQIQELLNSANTTLKDIEQNEDSNRNDQIDGSSRDHEFPSLDVVISQPHTNVEDEKDSEDEEPRKTKQDLESEIDREADDIIARVKDELKNAPPDSHSDEADDSDRQPISENTNQSNLPSVPAFDLPDTPLKDPQPTTTTEPLDGDTNTDTDLASRFASLKLPTTIMLPSTPSNKPGTSTTNNNQAKFGKSSTSQSYTEEKIDSWCTICLEDATLRCIGCDGDLYCAKCWIEGHRGPDAGFEERRHKAVEYNRPTGKKKEARGTKIAA